MQMILLEDTRNQVGKHKNIAKYCQENGIEIVRTKLVVGDYMSPYVAGISVDTKANIEEILQNITEKRFKNELMLAKKLGIHLVVLIECWSEIKCIDDVIKRENPRLEIYKLRLKKKLRLFGEFNEWYLYREAKAKGLNPSRPPISTEQLRKALHTIQNNEEYDVEFQFCSKEETGQKILEILSGK